MASLSNIRWPNRKNLQTDPQKPQKIGKNKLNVPWVSEYVKYILSWKLLLFVRLDSIQLQIFSYSAEGGFKRIGTIYFIKKDTTFLFISLNLYLDRRWTSLRNIPAVFKMYSSSFCKIESVLKFYQKCWLKFLPIDKNCSHCEISSIFNSTWNLVIRKFIHARL